MARTRRFHSLSFEQQVVLEVLSGETHWAALARRYEILPDLIQQWEKVYHEGRLDEGIRQDMKAPEARIREVERMVGKPTMENEFLKRSSSSLDRRKTGNR